MEREQFFTEFEFRNFPKEIMRIGHWGNARVFRVENLGIFWTVKDFSQSLPVVRSWGRLTLKHEKKVINRLRGMDGVPQKAFMVGPYTMAFEYIKGTSVNLAPREFINEDYLLKCEKLLRKIHDCGIVHLDTRGKTNWLVQPDGEPALIDYQSALFTHHLPLSVRKLLEDIDISGVYKKWEEFQPNKMGENRRKEKERIDKIRRLWVLKGYFGLKKGTKYEAPPLDKLTKK